MRIIGVVLVAILALTGCHAPLTASQPTPGSARRVYEHKEGSPWAKYRPDMSKHVVWIETSANAPATIVDGEVRGEPGSHGGNDYTTGGTVGFEDGSTDNLSRVMIVYLDNDEKAIVGPRASN